MAYRSVFRRMLKPAQVAGHAVVERAMGQTIDANPPGA